MQGYYSYSYLLFTALVLSAWSWQYPEDNPCVKIEGNLSFVIKYNKTNGENATVEKTYPKEEGVSITGKCPADTESNSEITMKWEFYTIDFVFTKSDEMDLWYTTMVQLRYDERHLAPDIKDPRSEEQRAGTNRHLFSSRKSHTYSCNANKTYSLFRIVNGTATTFELATMKTSNLTIVPYKDLLGPDKCSDDDKPTQPTPKPVPPIKPTPKPTPAPIIKHGSPTGSRVAWTCTIVSLISLSICGGLVYMNREGTPPYLHVV